MPTKTCLIVLAFAFAVLLASCRGSDQRTTLPTGAINFLRQPDKITYVRYTSYTPPWPTRIEAWIDWEHDRMRSWNVQWTDSPTNPSVCTSIRNGDDLYPCLPSPEQFDSADAGLLGLFMPDIPLRESSSSLNVRLPGAGSGDEEAASDTPPVQLDSKMTSTTKTRGSTRVSIASWDITSALGSPCDDEDAAGSPRFEYTTDADTGDPISEYITLICRGERQPYFGVTYHDLRFLDASDLPPNFFDVEATRTSLIAGEVSSAAAQLGAVYWLGEHPGEWALDGIEHDARSATFSYFRGEGRGADEVDLRIQKSTVGNYNCPAAAPVPNDPFHGSLCTRGAIDGNAIVWEPPAFDVVLDVSSYPPDTVSNDDLLALASQLKRQEPEPRGPELTSDAVRNLVADSLELVCPSKRHTIHDARVTSTFRFDRATGEWTGTFGSLGDYAVSDSKPAAIPIDNRDDVESTLSHNAAQFADCTSDELPAPQPGDDELAVTFQGTDDSGLTFQVTGVDSHISAALAVCMALQGGGCTLTDPDGAEVQSHGIDINDVRRNVEWIHIGIDDDALTHAGRWTLSLDLLGQKLTTSFQIP